MPSLNDLMLPCLSKKYLGIDCFGCGLQRSVAFLIQGDFEAAFYMYPGIYPLILTLGFIGFTFIKPVKHSFIIKLSLTFLTVTAIVANYFIKLFY